MKALVFSEREGLRLDANRPKPVPKNGEALIRIRRTGICSTDLEITRGYVPGFDAVLGHEFVGVVEECAAAPDLVGQRVTGEINCNLDPKFSDPDPIFVRNHAPKRVVLGIIGKDGCMAEYITLPVGNLHKVPDEISDQEAAFTEPLAAACRILEQQAVRDGQQIAVIGDGKFGLLIAQNLVIAGHEHRVTHFGRHRAKLDLVQGTVTELVDDNTKARFTQRFDVVIEASGSTHGIALAAALVRPLGTIVLKTTCSTVGDEKAPAFAAIANDIVVQELTLIGSRCGPFLPALKALQDPRIKQLVGRMVAATYPLDHGIEAIDKAKSKGSLKVVLVMDEN